MASEKQDRSRSNTVHMQSEKFSHEGELVWSIEKASTFMNDTLVSNEFSIAASCQIKWEAVLKIKESVNLTDIVIKRKDTLRKDVACHIECSLENSEGVAYDSYSLATTTFYNYYYNGTFQERKVSDSSKLNHKIDWDFKRSHDELLIVKLHLKLTNCCIQTKTGKHELQNALPKHQLPTDFLRGLQILLNEKPLTDVKFNVNGTTIAAHKTILCTRSPVFRNMLENDMSEARNGVIEIKDVQPEIVDKFMSYLYTDTIADASLDIIRQLYTLADKYEVGSLQDKCGSILVENLTDESVCKTLKLADLHNDDILKEAASIYVAGNYATLKHSAEFKALVETQPRLVLHILMCKCLD